MRGWLSERMRRWCTRGDPPEVAAVDEAAAIEAEDLSGWLIRMARQPGRQAFSVVLVGQRKKDKPMLGTWATIWWN